MRILIVEDDVELASSVKHVLEREGYAADYVTDGDMAIRRISVNRDEYDLIILDLTLPKREGIEVCRFVREKNIPIPIIVLTAHSDLSRKVATLNIGADDYLTKPFIVEELLARIRALLRRPKEIVPTVLQVNDIEMNTSTRTVTYRGRPIRLTVKEFALLEHLMRHPNQVISRNQLLDHLWGFDFNSFSNVIDVHVKNLRRKMKAKGVIETIRGVGYRIRVDNHFP